MKKWISPLLLLVLLMSLLSVPAAAAGTPTTDGIYGVTASGVITLRDADGKAVSASNAYAGYENFYADAVKFDVTCSGLSAGEQYLLLVLSDKGAPTDSNIVYINQKAADSSGTVTFDGMDAAYPSKLEKDKTYYVYVVGEGSAFKAEENAVTSFSYYQSYKLGDVTEDGVIDTMDAAAAINHYLEKATLTDAKFLAGDATKDGVVDTMDAAAMINHYLEKSFITG